MIRKKYAILIYNSNNGSCHDIFNDNCLLLKLKRKEDRKVWGELIAARKYKTKIRRKGSDTAPFSHWDKCIIFNKEKDAKKRFMLEAL